MFKKDIGYLFAILKMCDDFEIYKNDCGNLTNEFKQKYDKIEWRKIKDLRNVIVHDYMGVDKNKIKKILRENIPKLINELLHIINDLLRKNIIENNLLEASSKDFTVIKIEK
ncbi:MAG: DUF86 domain-containing protein [Candidatus Cloacimonetes bacterium]|nr:DUF86 domain-containing protein [Candidatus Cloacimonadota bacterium]MCF7815000.1 DUF86 domain-containing protein [Candidatus Cloacimonadota bacterium]MCF7869243.1 DUF86 domain-containing protein [Candidatus Cloacimonadota bacterium]MCF7884677.1 DUF86 domain-containing protein [Candidatus Cloacimonadota bacterium]